MGFRRFSSSVPARIVAALAIALAVLGAPSTTEADLTGTTQSFEAGAEVTLSIPGSVAADAPFQWYHDGIPLGDVDGVSGSQSRTLTLSNVQTGDSGAYSVSYDDGSKALNSYGPVFVQVNIAALPVSGAMGLGLLLGIITGLGVGFIRFMPPGAAARVRRRK